MVILPLFALSGWRWFPGRRKGKCMKKQYRVILAAALVLSLAGCHTQESRIDPEGSAGQGTGTTQESGATQGGTAQADQGTDKGPDLGDGDQKDDGTIYKVGKMGDDYILPDALTHVYTQKELAGLTQEELRLARNEIYARHGRQFKSNDLNQYFSQQPWYQGTISPDRFDDSVLSPNERNNLKAIQGMETGTAVCSIPIIGKEEFPRIDGSTATLPISQAMYRMATGASRMEAESAITHEKTTQAWMSLVAGYVSPENRPELVIAYEPGDRVLEAFEEPGNEVIMKPIGRDALVFLANRSNPVHSLTRSQIVDIYSGRTTNWKEVGGKDRKIQAFQRPMESGSQNLMEKLVMKGKKMAGAPVDLIVSDMEGLLENVSAYDGTGDALGYSVYYYARNMYQKPELTFMAVDGVMPSSETIRSKSYPFVNDFYAAVRADTPKDSKAYELFEWLTGEDGQSLINGLGYVGIGDGAKELPANLLAPDEDFTAAIPLPQGHVILADGDYLLGEQGIGVFDSHMNLLQFISHVDCDQVSLFLECSRDTVLPMMDTMTGGYGHYSIGKNQWVDREQDQDDTPFYWQEEAFAEAHPQLLQKYGVTAEDVEVRFYGEYAGVFVITDQQAEHYYDPNGKFLLDYETGGKGEEELPSRYVYGIDDHMAYIEIIDYRNRDNPASVQYHIYKDGRLMKTLTDEGGNISDIEPHFYTRSIGNYLYFYNYQDEPRAKFLYGYYGSD